MKVLLGCEKGGTGKTTIATNFASILANKGRDVLIIDTDPQGSASGWQVTRHNNQGIPRVGCIQKFGKNLAGEINDLATRYDDIIIDAGGRESSELRQAITVADFAIIPLIPSCFDLWTAIKMSELVSTARDFNPNLIAAVVISKASTNVNSIDAEGARELVAEYENLILTETVIKDRVSFRRAAGQGMGVIEAGLDEKAAEEIQQLFNEIYTDEVYQ